MASVGLGSSGKTRSQAGTQAWFVEVAADQHEPVGAWVGAGVLVEGEAVADEVEDVALVGLGQPQEALAAEQSWRAAGVEEVLEAGDREGAIAGEGQGSEAVFVQVGVVVGGAFAEQVDVEDQRQGDGGAGRMKDAGVGVFGADAGLDVGDAWRGGDVAFVEQDGVGMAQLMAGGDGVEVVEAEVFGVGDSNDRIETEGFAEFGAEEGEGYGKWVSDRRWFLQ